MTSPKLIRKDRIALTACDMEVVLSQRSQSQAFDADHAAEEGIDDQEQRERSPVRSEAKPSSVDEEIAGVASGATNAAFQIGGALGTAVVSGVVVSQGGDSTVPTVLTEGFQAGFTTDLVIALIGLCVAVVPLRPLTRRTRDKTYRRS